VRRLHNPDFARKNGRLLSWFALPIGIESGFSSAGAGALGTVLLLNYSEMSPSEVVGTDLLFGLGLAAVGSAIHLKFGSVSSGTLLQLLAAGIPGVLLGFVLARRTPVRKLKSAIAMIAILAGLQLVWTGGRSLMIESARGRGAPQTSASANANAREAGATERVLHPNAMDMRSTDIEIGQPQPDKLSTY
jgi:uncharacterized membrane protein YfcA